MTKAAIYFDDIGVLYTSQNEIELMKDWCEYYNRISSIFLLDMAFRLKAWEMMCTRSGFQCVPVPTCFTAVYGNSLESQAWSLFVLLRDFTSQK